MPATISTTSVSFISVYNDDELNPYFRLTLEEALAKIGSQTAGNALLAAITGAAVAPDPKDGFKVKIIRADVKANINSPGAEGGSMVRPWREDKARGGAGCLAACWWNPNIYNSPSAAGSRPAFIGLAHELVHCMHALLGTMKNGYDEEEKFTVGLAPYDTVAISENTIRAEHQIAARTSY